MNVVTLNKSNFREVAPTLREIADQIERGDFGEVGCAGLVILGKQMDVFGMGIDSEAPSVALLLHAGFLRMSKAIEGHGE